MSGAAAWADAVQALALFAVDPAGLGGISLRAGPGPVRDHFLALLRDALPDDAPLRRLPVHAADERVLGGLDLAATLQAGKPVVQKGLLAEADGGVVLLAMAERIEPATAARLCAALDDGAVKLQRDGLSHVLPTRFGIVALDEGSEPDEHPPAKLLDRLAFHLDLTEVSARDIEDPAWTARDLAVARDRLVAGRVAASATSSSSSWPDLASTFPPAWPDLVRASTPLSQPPQQDGDARDDPGHDTIASAPPASTRLPSPACPSDRASLPDPAEALCTVAFALGIDSVRAPLLALRAARVVAAITGTDLPSDTDLGLAARLILVPRATRFPPPQDAEQPQPDVEPDQPPPPEDPPPEPDSSEDTIPNQPLADIVLEAAVAALPPDLLARLAQQDPSRGQARAAGRAQQTRASTKRGRPIGTRQGEPKNGNRLHLLETLKAAAPWQTIRRRTAGSTRPRSDEPAHADALPRFEVRRDDFRIIRFRQRIGTTTIFAVDASGSAAMQRLGEAKGAVELLLADCYVRRDQVALIAFRGQGATTLLPPTGSLLRAKRSLAGLPGGGPTPLAAGIDAATALALGIRRTGRTPVITILTDARANIARDGSGGRPRAEAEALESARLLRAAGIAALLVDTSPRPNPFARRLADEMHAQYVPLPYADASALSRAVRFAVAA